jgi:hypothetical protein
MAERILTLVGAIFAVAVVGLAWSLVSRALAAWRRRRR